MVGPLTLLLSVAPILGVTTAAAAPPPGTPVLRQSAELVSPPLGAYGHQGMDVALSADGSTLAVASLTWSEESPPSVVVHHRSGGSWRTQTTLAPPTTESRPEHWASAVAISADGDTLAVTNPVTTVLVAGRSVPLAGVVHLFTRSG